MKDPKDQLEKQVPQGPRAILEDKDLKERLALLDPLVDMVLKAQPVK